MADTWYTNPLDVATQGLLSGQPITIAVQGFLVRIEEGPLPPEPTPDLGLRPEQTGGGAYEEIRKTKKLITITVHKGNKTYWQTKEIVDINVKIEDINIFITEGKDKKPIVKVDFPEGDENGRTIL